MTNLHGLFDRNRAFFYAIVIFVLLMPSSFVRSAIGMDHLAGTIHAFEYFFDNGFQFGKDIFDNVGPYGFLHYPSVYSGKSFYMRTVSFVAVIALFSFFAAAFLSKLKKLHFTSNGFPNTFLTTR